jgi:hypothetical protein
MYEGRSRTLLDIEVRLYEYHRTEITFLNIAYFFFRDDVLVSMLGTYGVGNDVGRMHCWIASSCHYPGS